MHDTVSVPISGALPFDDEQVRQLRAGERVTITGHSHSAGQPTAYNASRRFSVVGHTDLVVEIWCSSISGSPYMWTFNATVQVPA